MMDLPEGRHWCDRIEIVAYHDLEGRPGFKMALQQAGGRWYLYIGHLWQPGWSILDVTDATSPRHIRFIDGPANTWTIQVQVAGGRMVTSLEKIDPGWGDDPDAPFEEGLLIWDVSSPTEPAVLGRFRTGGQGMHRNYFDGGDLVHSSSAAPGFDGHIYQIIDVSDPSAPVEAGRWWVRGQWRGGGEKGVPNGTSLHAPYIHGDRAYLAYGAAGLVIVDISDPARPAPVGRLGLSPPFNPIIAAHTAMPLPKRDLVLVNSEAIEEDCHEPLCFAGVVDISNEEEPRVIALFPLPVPPEDAPFTDFCERGGRFGPHNLHQCQGDPALLDDQDLALLTYFNAGLRVIDTSTPRLPREIASFVPPDPLRRRGVLPKTLTAQTEDVIADARGYVYVTDKNHGLYVLRLTI